MKVKRMLALALTASMVLGLPVSAQETEQDIMSTVIVEEELQSEANETEPIQEAYKESVVETEESITIENIEGALENEDIIIDETELVGEDLDVGLHDRFDKDSIQNWFDKINGSLNNNNKQEDESEEESQKETDSTDLEEDTTGVRGFVNRLYEKVLNRKADPSGLDTWTNLLTSKQMTGAEVARGFIESAEFKARNLSDEAYVTVLYNTFFDRGPDAGGKQTWMDALASGLSRSYVFKGFAESKEFSNLCAKYGIERGSVILTEPRDQNAGVTKFVYRCYKVFLGRTADNSGLNMWCTMLLTNQMNAKEVARGFVMSQEFANMNLNYYAYVETMYLGLFNRNADAGGLEMWVNKLMGGFSFEDIFNGFADSQEFRSLAASFGLANNWKSVPFYYLVDNGIYTLQFPLSWKGRFAEAGDGNYTCYYDPEAGEYLNSNYAVEIAYVYFVEDLYGIDRYPDYEVLGYSDKFDVYAVAVYPTDVPPFEDYNNNVAIWYAHMTSCMPYLFKSIQFK